MVLARDAYADVVDTRVACVTMLLMDIEHVLIHILREAAFRAFIDNPRAYGAPAIRFLRASQRYV